MNESVRMIVVLTVIAMVSGGLLAWVNDWTGAIISENQLQAMMASIQEVLPTATGVERLSSSPSTLVEEDPDQAVR